MRVISGKAKGTRLVTIEGLNTRPTTDRIKESIFNLIQFDIPEAKVLDLFAGSGALGLEAASRGAASVTFIEQHRPCHKAIAENVERCRLDNCQLIKGDVIANLPMAGGFDVILMDPPYHKHLVVPVIEAIVLNKNLKTDGIIMAEHHRDDIMPETIGPLHLIKYKRYGITGISIYGYDG